MVARGWCKVQETLLTYFIIFEMEIHEHIQVLRGGAHSSKKFSSYMRDDS